MLLQIVNWSLCARTNDWLVASHIFPILTNPFPSVPQLRLKLYHYSYMLLYRTEQRLSISNCICMIPPSASFPISPYRFGIVFFFTSVCCHSFHMSFCVFIHVCNCYWCIYHLPIHLAFPLRQQDFIVTLYHHFRQQNALTPTHLSFQYSHKWKLCHKIHSICV